MMSLYLKKKREGHLLHLQHIFNICKKYGISLNPKKSIFVVTKGNILGFMVSKEAMNTYPERIEAISQIIHTCSKK